MKVDYFLLKTMAFAVRYVSKKMVKRRVQRRQHSNDFHFSIVIKFLSERFFFKLKIENIGGKIITMKTREEEMRNVFLKEATKRYSDTEKIF